MDGPPPIGSLLDLYWGGPERRITGITLRIIVINALALLVLMMGILYLGQYQSSVIRFRLDTFQTELELIAITLSEGAETPGSKSLSAPIVRRMAGKFAKASNQHIRIFDKNGALIADSLDVWKPGNNGFSPEKHFKSTQLLKEFARLVLALLPQNQTLPAYPAPKSANGDNHPDVVKALGGNSSLSAWQGEGSKILLSAAAPLGERNAPIGAVLLTREGQDIEEELARVWIDVLKIFAMTLILTITMSIYLSGIIARPLKKLARATEAVRKGQACAKDIPDLSNRHDEIGELSLALRQMTQALWERMDSIERFAADVSHELKNPLTSLRSAVETLEIARTDTDRQKLLEVIRHDLQRLDRLITDISSASRLEAELSREEPEKINLETLLSSLMDVWADPLARQNNAPATDKKTGQKHRVTTGTTTIALNTPSPGETLTTWGLEGRLAQVFQNLLANALSFSPEGGTITITIRSADRTVTVTIEDQGPGIPETKLETIFERFYSERPQHEDYGRHSGLGLSICRQIITAHGGKIFAENLRNERGQTTGARFSVILNRAQQTD